MTYLKGCDYAFEPYPAPTALKAAGVHFVCRYLSNDGAKNLSNREKEALQGEDIAIVLNWEQDATAMALGRDQGVSDATTARNMAADLGMSEAPIYFSADFHANVAQIVAAVEYMQGVNSVIGVKRSGIYGDFAVTEACVLAGVTTYTWGTPAWDGDPVSWVVDIYQYGLNGKIGDGDVDYDAAYPTDYGQWPRPVIAPPDPPPVVESKRHVATGDYSLSDVAVAHGTTFEKLAAATTTSKIINAHNLELFRKYYDPKGGARTKMPKGLVYFSAAAFGGQIQ